MSETVSFLTLSRLSDLLDAAQRHHRVTFSTDGGDHVTEGVARHFTDANGNFLAWDDDVLNAHFRVSATVEHFLPVRDVLRLMDAGMFHTHTDR